MTIVIIIIIIIIIMGSLNSLSVLPWTYSVVGVTTRVRTRETSERVSRDLSLSTPTMSNQLFNDT